MTEPAVPGLTRHYVTLGDRQVHYRRMGKGPAVLLLHRAPRSSEDLVPMMQTLSQRLTVIAPDIAGYGASWALHSAQPTIPDYAADLIAFMEAVGIARAPVYAEQAAACIALEAAQAAPDRISGVVARDIMIDWWEDPDLARINLNAFLPSWDGSHYAWLWAFLRDEAVFEPFYRRDLAHRLDQPLPSARDLQARARQFVSPVHHGRKYALALEAALSWDINTVLPKLTCPHVVLGAISRRQGGLVDWLKIKHPGHIETVEDTSAADARVLSLLSDWTSSADPAAPPVAVKPIPGRLWNDYADVDGGQIHFHCNTDPGTTPIFIQHDAASSIGTVVPITETFVGTRSVFSVDMPGSGLSDNLIGHDTPAEVDVYARALGQMLEARGIGPIDFYGMWGGGFVGLELALQTPNAIRLMILSNVFQTPDADRADMIANYTPDVSSVWHGGHLQQMWHQMRDQATFFPWWNKSRDGIIWKEPFIDTNMVHERTCSLMKAGNMYGTAYHAHFRYPTHAKLRQSPVPTFVASTPWDPQYEETQEAAEAAPNCTFLALDDDFTKWGTSFLPQLEAADRGES